MSGYRPKTMVQGVALLFVALLAGARSLPAQQEIFSDGFESGDICAWTKEVCVERPFAGDGLCSVFLYMHDKVQGGDGRERIQSQADSWWKSSWKKGNSSWEMRKEARRDGKTLALTFGGGWFRLDPGDYECVWSVNYRRDSLSNSYPFTVNEDCEVTP